MVTGKKKIVPNTIQRDRYDIAVSGEYVNAEELSRVLDDNVKNKYPYDFKVNEVSGGFNITVLQEAGVPSFKLLDAVRDVASIICEKCHVGGAPIHKSHWVENRSVDKDVQLRREAKQMSWLVSSCAKDGLFKKFTPRQTDYDRETAARNDD